MAKKKHKKKHNFQHKNAPVAVAAPVAATSGTVKAAAKPATMPNEWREVRDDVRRSLILAGVFIVLMIILWYFLDVSTFGKNLYNSIKL